MVAEEAMENRYALRSRGFNLAFIASRVSRVLGMKPDEVWAKGKYRRAVQARRLLCYWAARGLGMPMSSPPRELGISIPTVSNSVARGRRIAEGKGFRLVENQIPNSVPFSGLTPFTENRHRDVLANMNREKRSVVKREVDLVRC
jgi:hypothetical protein